MNEMIQIRSLVNPAMGISEVEFSKLEIVAELSKTP